MNGFGSGRFSIPPVVKWILIINVVLFFITAGLGTTGSIIGYKLALFNFKSQHFNPYQLITHMFMHGGFSHIFFNMFAVFIFGRVLEGVWGSKKFFIFYIVTGLGAALLHLLVNQVQLSILISKVNEFNQFPSPEIFQHFVDKYVNKPSVSLLSFIDEWIYDQDNPGYAKEATLFMTKLVQSRIDIPTVGASGAVFGILIAFAMIFPNVELMIIFFPVPIKAKYLIPLYAVAELFFGIANFQWDNVAHFAHLGGALVGFILVKIWKQNRFTRY
ncbi:MAG: rhomboid family intramembrane serine protease [Bacteroidales bacterium]|nr:rhomboid family intramembrane serine protease [Bacteroidales bacterium]